MRSLALAVRGIWWRRWASLAICAVGVVCAAIAAAGPAFASAARDAILQSTVQDAPPGADGTGVSVALSLDGSVSRQAFQVQTSQAFAVLVNDRAFSPPVFAQAATLTVQDDAFRATASAPMVYRAGSCAHITLRAGRCVSERDRTGVVITTDTARIHAWHVGTSLALGTVPPLTVHVVGVYDPVEPSGAYWFAGQHRYFGQAATTRTAAVPAIDAVLVPDGFWSGVPVTSDGRVEVSMDFALVPSYVHTAGVAALQNALGITLDIVQDSQAVPTATPRVDTNLPPILDTAARSFRSVGAPILLVAAQLLVLTWLVLYLVLVGSGEARTPEIVLGKLRGLSPRESVVHALLEPLVLVAVAVPAGVGVAGLALHAAGPHVFGSTTELTLPPLSWAAALAAGLGGVAAAVLASVSVLRRSIIDQWRRTRRRPRRAGWAMEAVVATLAIAGFVDLATAPVTRTGFAQFLPACGPALLALAVALVGVRVVPLLARLGLRRTRASRWIAPFLALRQIGRRPADLRVFVLLTVSVALVVFALVGRAVFTGNQHDRAFTDVGAARVVSIAAPVGVDPTAVVARLDPSGRQASAVYAGSIGLPSLRPNELTDDRPPPAFFVVDPASFAPVAFWRSDFGSKQHLADELRPLRATPPAPIRISAVALMITLRTGAVRARLPLRLSVGLTDAHGSAVLLPLATLPPSGVARTERVTVAVPQCAAGCLFRRFALLPSAGDYSTPAASVELTAVDAVSSTGTRSVLPALRDSTWTSPDTNGDGVTSVAVSTPADGLAFDFAPQSSPVDPDVGYQVASDVPTAVPALVTAALLPGESLGSLAAIVSNEAPLVLLPYSVSVLPRAERAGVVISRAWLPAARPGGYGQYRPNQVWLAAGAPADFPARLAAAGLPVRSVTSANARIRALAASGPSYAVDMLVLGAATAGLLAVLGTVVSLLVASRRRLYEMAAMRALGLRPRRVLGALVLEQGVVVGTASALGLGAGIAGARVALPRIPEFADTPVAPALLYDIPVVLGVLLAVIVVVAVLAAVVVGGLTLVHRASPTRLREAQG